jgi:hypothetical protein
MRRHEYFGRLNVAQLIRLKHAVEDKLRGKRKPDVIIEDDVNFISVLARMQNRDHLRSN